MIDDDDDFAHEIDIWLSERYPAEMGHWRQIRTVKTTEWTLSSSGRYEAKAEVVRTGDGRFFVGVWQSHLGGDIGDGDPEWHGPFADEDAAIRAAGRAPRAWLQSVDP